MAIRWTSMEINCNSCPLIAIGGHQMASHIRFGFIKLDDGGRDLFCHVSGLLDGEGSVKEGDGCRFKTAFQLTPSQSSLFLHPTLPESQSNQDTNRAIGSLTKSLKKHETWYAVDSVVGSLVP